MATLPTLISRGRAVLRAEQVNAGTGVFLAVLLKTGPEADSTLIDRVTLADVLAVSANVEAAWTGGTPYARKSYSQVVVTRQPTNDRVTLDLATDPTWSTAASPTTTYVLGKCGICYAPTANAANNLIEPLTWIDYPVTADGSNLTVTLDAAGFYST
jgi:hypothetical protein